MPPMYGDESDDAPATARLSRLLDEHGSNPMASLVLNGGGWNHFWGRSADGVICYLQARQTAVAWCDPLCDPAHLDTLVGEFTTAMRRQKLRACFLVVQEPTARAALARGYAVLKIGEEPVFDLRTWRPPRGDPGKKLRWALNHARRAGIGVEEYRFGERPDPRLDSQAVEVREAWQRSLGRPAVGSFLRTDPLGHAETKRVFYAVRGGRIEALLACAPVPARDGWYLEDIIRRPDAVNGATELLIVSTLERLAQDGASFATIGVAPLRGSDEQIDRRARWIARTLRFGFDRMDSVFHFASLSRFKSKFRPTSWEPRYVAFNPPRPSLGLVWGVMNVLETDPDPMERAAQA